MSACTWKTSVSAASNGCCHRGRGALGPPAPARGSPAPGSARPRPSPSAPCRPAGSRRRAPGRSAPASWSCRLYWPELLLAITLRPGSAASLPRTSSVMPSAKYSSAESPRFSKGSTASSRVVPGRRRLVGGGERSQPNSTPRPSRKPSAERERRGAPAGAARSTAARAAAALPAPDVGVGARGCPMPQRPGELGGGGEPVGGRLRQRARNRPRHASGTVSRTSRSGRGGSSNRRAIIACAVGAGERRLAGEHLVEHAAEAVDVAPGVQLAVGRRLLRAHVGRGADREAGLGQPLVRRPRQRPRDPEVGDQRLPVRSRMFSGLMSRCTTPCRWA